MSISFFRPKGFTLLEIMIVLTIIGILASALFPSVTGYLKRGRDTTRITDVDRIGKTLALYLTDEEEYPNHVWGCVNIAALVRFSNGTQKDPVPTHNNGCTPGEYWYASGSFALNPHVYSLVAIMEQPNGGNYTGTLAGFTGTMTASAYASGTTQLSKWSGDNYIKFP